MGIPNRQIGWDQQSNLLWQLQAQINKLGKTMSQCCGSSSGCISFTDITWEAFITAVNAGTIADCYYNITNRPNSGTDPLYVLVEKGLPNFDNEVRRSEQASSALCITTDQGVGCFNVYAESETISFDYVEGATVYPVRLADCSIFAEGDIVTFTSAISPFPTYTGVIHYGSNGLKCLTFFQITGGTGPIPPSPLDQDGNFSNGIDNIDGILDARAIDNCIPFPTLSVGDVISGYLSPEGGVATATITSITGTTVTIAPTSGDWTGISVFYIGKGNACLFVTTAPITSTSILLTPDPVCFDFDNLLGYSVYLNTLMQATDSLIYGTLQSHNDYDGQLFSMDPVTEQVKILFNFDDSNTYGYSPSSGLVEIAGELYGTCNGGGPNDAGTIWKWNIATDTFTVLYSMDGPTEGIYPYGTLLYVGGKLYGTCSEGGANDVGTLFEFDPIAVTYTVLLQMDDNENIQYPQGPLKEIISGELWGTSINGGINDVGTVFKYTLSSGVDEIVVNLDDVPNGGDVGAGGGVMLASDGNVYFNTSLGGDDDNGTLCVITNISTTPVLNVVYSFDVNYGLGDAVCPVEIAGNLYGCTNNADKSVEQGCTPLVGSIYKYDISVDIFTTLYTFNGSTDGGSPYLGQLLPLGDVLYGMTNEVRLELKECPIDQPGQIFKYNITTETYTNVQPLGVPVSSPAGVATSICESIVDPGYTCTTVGGCLFVSGTQFGNEAGQTLVVRTIVTFEGDLQGCTAPTVGQLLYNDDAGDLVGTVLSFTGSAPFTMEVELDDNANPGYTSLPFNAYIQGDGCIFVVGKEEGTILDYTVKPFEGGKEPVNRPCYYNATYDVITDYPLSQPHTKAEIDYLVNNNLLVPGAFYHIMDVDKFLYGGTQIVIQANSVHSFNDTAMGLFYNPRYDQSVNGFGIYDRTATYAQGDTAIWGGLVITFADGSPIGNGSAYNLEYDLWTFPGKFKVFLDDASVFTAGEIVYDPNNSSYSMLVTEVGVDYIIVSCPPLFLSFATELDNGSSAANIDSIELHEAFYSDLIYNAVWDEITYDYANDFISSRKDNAGNAVEQTWNYYKVANDEAIYRAIAGFQWGNEYAINNVLEDNVGMYGNKITESYVEVINFTLRSFNNNTFKNSKFLNNIFDRNGNSIFNNIFQNDSYVENVEFTDRPGFNRNVFNSSYLVDSVIDGNSFSDNILNNSEIEGIPSGGTTDFVNNAVKGSFLDLSTQAGNIERTNFDYVDLTDDISGAARIYQTTYAKEVVSSNGAGNFIKYVSATGTYIVAAVTV
jgi:uncharacterized repeat protein (TIGR03803 family)